MAKVHQRRACSGGTTMRPARIIAAVVVAAALAVTGCSADSTATRPSPAPQPPETAPSLSPMPTTPPQPGPAPQASAAPTTPTTLGFDRIPDPQLAANRLVAAWLRGDRAAAGTVVTSQDVVERLFREAAPAKRPPALPCRLAEPGLYVCSYPLAEHAELSVFVVGGASAGYGVRGIEFGD
jgi:hypothetical protein